MGDRDGLSIVGQWWAVFYKGDRNFGYRFREEAGVQRFQVQSLIPICGQDDAMRLWSPGTWTAPNNLFGIVVEIQRLGRFSRCPSSSVFLRPAARPDTNLRFTEIRRCP